MTICTVLGIRMGSKVSIINPPSGFVSMLNPLPDGVEFLITAQSGLDVILFFPENALDLVERLPALARAMAVTGGIWICWKHAEEKRARLSEEFVRQAALDIGLVDNKRAQLDGATAGLRLVWRPRGKLEKPETRKKKAPVAEA